MNHSSFNRSCILKHRHANSLQMARLTGCCVCSLITQKKSEWLFEGPVKAGLPEIAVFGIYFGYEDLR